jgi:hypothetical protein
MIVLVANAIVDSNSRLDDGRRAGEPRLLAFQIGEIPSMVVPYRLSSAVCTEKVHCWSVVFDANMRE